MPPNDRNQAPTQTRPPSGAAPGSNVPATQDGGAGTALARPAQQKRRTLADRLQAVTAQSSLKEGDHLEDLVLYRNATKVPQSLTNLQGKQVMLLPKGIYTDKSVREYERNPDATLEKFDGGTIILTRQAGIPLVASGILEELEVVDKADPDDFGQ